MEEGGEVDKRKENELITHSALFTADKVECEWVGGDFLAAELQTRV
jgi:hypothetical protein